jgi:hypothetical protein
MTQYKKIVFMDADTLVFRNIDHLFGPEYPMFTAAFTTACCNPVAAPIPSGGFWIVEPDVKWCVHGAGAAVGSLLAPPRVSLTTALWLRIPRCRPARVRPNWPAGASAPGS